MAETTTVEVRFRAITLGDTTLGVLADAEQSVDLAPGLEATANGLKVMGNPTFEDCELAVNKLRVLEKGTGFAIGDAMIYMEEKFDEKASQVFDASSGWSLSSLRNYHWLARSIAPERRRMDRLGLSHHQQVAGLSPAKQEKWLNAAADSDPDGGVWTVARLKKALKEGEDLAPTGFWVIASAESEEDQERLIKKLEAEGRSCRATKRRTRQQVEG